MMRVPDGGFAGGDRWNQLVVVALGTDRDWSRIVSLGLSQEPNAVKEGEIKLGGLAPLEVEAISLTLGGSEGKTGRGEVEGRSRGG
jgi:hypothetical protein